MNYLLKLCMHLLILCWLATPVAAQRWMVLEQFPAPSNDTRGLAWDGEYLWAVHGDDDGTIFKIDVDTKQIVQQGRIDPVALHPTVPAHTIDFEGLAYGDGLLYMHVLTRKIQNEIIVIDPQTITLKERWRYHKGLVGQGLAYDHERKAVWAVQGTDINNVVENNINLVRGNEILETIVRPEVDTPNDYGDGLTYINGLLATVPNDGIISMFVPGSDKRVLRVKSPTGGGIGPEGLAWDGEYLWFADRARDSIYKLGLVDDRNLDMSVDSRNNSLSPDANADEIQAAAVGVTLLTKTVYRITLHGEAYADDQETPLPGVTLQYTDAVGLTRALIRPGEAFFVEVAELGADNLLSYIVDDSPEDNVGAFELLIEATELPTSVEERGSTAPVNDIEMTVYPNPSRSSVTIDYFVPQPTRVRVSLKDYLGRTIMSLVDARQSSGWQSLQWDGDVADGSSTTVGLYYCEVVIGNQRTTRVISLTR